MPSTSDRSVHAGLEAQLGRLGPADRRRYRKRLAGASRIASDERRSRVLETIAADLANAAGARDRRRRALPASIDYPPELPITGRREDLLVAIRDHQVVVVAGETGSGKSTQLPKLCLELGRGIDGFIGHTQPRRIAARAVAARVAEELGVPLGGPVGYAVRFSDQVGDDTLVKVMTDGLLLAEIQRDPELRGYDTLIVDEAHERSLNIDVLLGYLRRLLPRRPDLKVILTSATIDTARFSRHFGDAPIVEVSGRNHPIEVRYRPLEDPDEPDTQAEGIAKAVVELMSAGPGDVLVFCAAEREIREAAEAVEALEIPKLEVLPLYARLPAGEQQRVFSPHRGRRVVIATNVAETSLTVPGIRFVVDTGTARIARYGRRTKVQRLPIEPVSQASADQRAGRCGRLGPGVCIRLYAEDDYLARPRFTEPEIQRTNLASVILRLAALGMEDIESFPFLDPPDRRSIRDGIRLLEELGAVDPRHEGSRRWLTGTGRQLARMPVDPRVGRMVLEADRTGCLREVAIIAAVLSIPDPRERPAGKEEAARQSHARFSGDGSDFTMWLRLWEHLRRERRARSARQFRRLCEDDFISHRRVREWFDVHDQLRAVADDLDMVIGGEPADAGTIHRALLAGLLSHVGWKEPTGHEYRGAHGSRFWISPGSELFKSSPRWVMAAQLVETDRLWARVLAPVAPEWIERAGAHLVRRSYSDPWWDPDRGAAVARETVTLYGLTLASDRTVGYTRIDRPAARELFIRHALVLAEWTTTHSFATRNARRLEEVREMEARSRRGGLLLHEDDLVRLFDRRLPPEVATRAELDAWLRRDPAAARSLELTVDDLLDPAATAPDQADFPTEWRHGDLALPVVYQFEPGSPSDGVTVEVPVEGLSRVDPAALAWNVPGLREDLVAALVRALPKSIRRHLVPVPDTVRAVLADLELERGPVEAVRSALVRRSGLAILPEHFDLDRVPTHLLIRFRVVSPDGSVLGEGTDLAALRNEIGDPGPQPGEAEVSELTAWTIGELQRRESVAGPSGPMTVFPALVDDGESVSVRRLGSEAEQWTAMWDGTRRLLMLALPKPRPVLRALLDDRARLVLKSAPHVSTEEWIEDCATATADTLLDEGGGPVWDGVAFDRLVERAKASFAGRLLEAGEGSLDALESFRSALLALEDLDPRFEDAAADVVEQLRGLVYPGFVAGVGLRHLPHLSRYLRAVEHRLERLPADPARDRERTERVRGLEAEYRRLADSLPVTPELLEVGWALQELRVSLFAQPLGTDGPVSEKRIRRALGAVAFS